MADDRFERRIFIPLPEEQARTKMFELNVGETPNNLIHKEFKQLGEMTEGYSGSDIAIAVRDALMEPIRKLRVATHFKQVLPPQNNLQEKDFFLQRLTSDNG